MGFNRIVIYRAAQFITEACKLILDFSTLAVNTEARGLEFQDAGRRCVVRCPSATHKLSRQGIPRIQVSFMRMWSSGIGS